MPYDALSSKSAFLQPSEYEWELQRLWFDEETDISEVGNWNVGVAKSADYAIAGCWIASYVYEVGIYLRTPTTGAVWERIDDGTRGIPATGGEWWNWAQCPGVAISSSGQYILLHITYYYIYDYRIFLSTNYGASFTEITSSMPRTDAWYQGHSFPTISETGQYMSMGFTKSDQKEVGVFLSSDYGVNWSYVQLAASETTKKVLLLDLAMSWGTGQYLIATGQDEISDADRGFIAISTNYGANWSFTYYFPETSRPQWCAINKTGSVMYYHLDLVAEDYTKLYVSKNYGTSFLLAYTHTFLEDFTNRFVCNDTGEVVIVPINYSNMNYVQFIISSNYGETFAMDGWSTYNLYPWNAELNDNMSIICIHTDGYGIWFGYTTVEEPPSYLIKAISTALFGDTINKTALVTKDEMDKISTQPKSAT